MNIIQANKILNKLMACTLKEVFCEHFNKEKLLKFNHVHKDRFSYIVCLIYVLTTHTFARTVRIRI